MVEYNRLHDNDILHTPIPNFRSLSGKCGRRLRQVYRVGFDSKGTENSKTQDKSNIMNTLRFTLQISLSHLELSYSPALL